MSRAIISVKNVFLMIPKKVGKQVVAFTNCKIIAHEQYLSAVHSHGKTEQYFRP
jgi:hypothetical protein